MQRSPIRFIIVSATRTGSTLLRDMLRSHPDVFVGGDVFNYRLTSEASIPWYEIGGPSDERAKINLDENLKRMREADPERLIEELINVTHAWGYSVIGFKCHYWFPDLEDPAGQYLIKDKSIRVIHVKRRNLLRRLISLERALVTDSWYRMRGGNDPELPSVTLPIGKLLEDIIKIEAAQTHYDTCFKEHQILEIFYEDLAKNPQSVAIRALNFLEVKALQEFSIQLEKQGVDTLRAAVRNYDELQSSLLRWASFFDD